MPQEVQVLFEDIERKIQDESYSREKLVQFLNQGLMFIANTLRPQSLTRIFIPFQTIEGDEPTPLPEDLLFPHILSVFDDADDPVFLTTHLTDVDHISRSRRRAMVLGMDGAYLFPVEDRGMLMRLTYVSKPRVVEEDDDDTTALDFLPEPLGRQAIVAYVCREIYNEIEDGIDGKKVNSEGYHAEFIRALSGIQDIIGQGNLARRPERILGDPFSRTHYGRFTGRL